MAEIILEPSHHDALAPQSLELVERLARHDWALDLYLAGSAALTLYLGHRQVRDLDLMGVHRLRSPQRRDLMQDLLAIEPGVRVETARDGFLSVRFPESWNDACLRLYYYPYPLVGPEENIVGLSVASALDLGLMKLGAVASRAARRDFVDLYLLTRRLPLRTLLEHSQEKFGHVRDFPLQALKGLADLSSARQEPIPALRTEVGWNDVEAWVRGEVREVAREWVGLGASA
ncbi:MAG: nucleotidyl transferase AbiEii/AbiGii toxin family protein [Thermoanaerobaculia bacterium]|nr:nucleotidyl transferase AbiEii/AbiGii toxin family protein [Thermoanaerobaculia bacterium]